MSPKQNPAYYNHKHPVEYRQNTIGTEKQEPRNIGSQVEDKGQQKLVETQNPKQGKLFGAKSNQKSKTKGDDSV